MEFDEDRLKKLESLKKHGFDPYGHRFERTTVLKDIKENFDKFNGKEEVVAGRILGKRDHGKIKFFDIIDESGQLQVYISENNLDDRSKLLIQYLDIGDIIGVSGTIIKTKTNEISISAKKLDILTKSLIPLPHRWYGLEDTETRFRKRYLDLIMNPEVKDRIKKASKVISAVRRLLESKGFTEFETRVLQPIYGGANAKPFITHYNALDRDMYLRVSDELYLKRLLVGGYEKVFEIGKDFRNEGMDTMHNPEFLMLELYQAYADLSDMINITKEIIKTVAYELNNSYDVSFDNALIHLDKFETIKMEDSVIKFLGKKEPKELIEIAKGIDPLVSTYGEAINTLFEEYVQKKLIQPTFVTTYPIEVSPLAKRVEDNPKFVYRFELFINGMEIANAFSELNDPIDQIERFKLEAERRKRGVVDTQQMDEDFIEALGYGMPPAGGLGIGMGRLQMLITGTKSIKEVIPFPQLRTILNDKDDIQTVGKNK